MTWVNDKTPEQVTKSHSVSLKYKDIQKHSMFIPIAEILSGKLGGKEVKLRGWVYRKREQKEYKLGSI